MKLSDFLCEVRGGKIYGDAEIGGLCTDSRVAGKGDLFFCFCGTHEDGHKYAPEAAERGAAALVCERRLPVGIPQLVVPDGREGMARIAAAFFGHPERTMQFAGVTGTNGKTTTATMIAEIMAAAGRKVGLVGTLGARYGNVVVPPSLTTPDPVCLFSLLADMANAGTEIAVLEVSAHALALKKEVPILYDVAVFTNLTRDHLDFFGNMQAYGAAKKLLFSPARAKFSVLNADDPFAAELSGRTPCITYGLETPADAFAVLERENLRGCRAVLNLEDELCEVTVPLTGRHNLLNALAAACAARRLGADAEAIARGIGNTRVEGRLEWVANYRGGDIFVDFAHTPDGLLKSLRALREHCGGRLIALFGCGGNRDAGKRPKMGEVAASCADFSVLTSDNPRYEDPVSIISEIEAGYRPVSRQYVVVEEREKAIRYALDHLCEGDVLLVAGKGAEKYQEIMGIKYDYDDKAVIESLIGN